MTDTPPIEAELEPAAAPSGSRVPLIIGVVAVLVAVAGGAALFMRAGQEDPQARLAAAAGAAEGAGSFRIEMKMEVKARSFGFSFGGTGAVADAKRGLMTMTMEVAGTETQMVSGDGKIYVKLPATGIAAAGGKQWASYPVPSAANPAAGGDLLSSSNPLAQLRQLGAVDGPIQDLGTETIRGTEATHLRAFVDLRKVSEKTGVTIPPEAAAAMSQLGNVPYDVWLNVDDLPVRVGFSMELNQPPAGKVTTSMTMDYFDFGVEGITVELPPASDVFETDMAGAQRLLGQGMASSSGSMTAVRPAG